jgi:hypothetical protein
MVILKESGCYITGGKDSFQRDLAGQPDDLGSLMKSRRYTFVRAVAPSEVSSEELPHHTHCNLRMFCGIDGNLARDTKTDREGNYG